MAKKRWIKSATSDSHGQFRAKAEKAGKSTLSYAHEHDEDGGKLGKQSVLAENLMKAAHHRAHKAHKASAPHSVIRKSMYEG